MWKWLYNLSRDKLKELHIQKHKVDIKCSNCQEWYSISGVRYKHPPILDADWGYTTRCGQCKGYTHWNTEIAPFPVRCDKNGNPFETRAPE